MGKIDEIEQLRQFLGDRVALFEHCLAVAQVAEKLAQTYQEDSGQAFTAGLLHDIGGVYPNDARIAAAEKFGIALLPEEREFPLIIHQKLSRALAVRNFGIKDAAILQAIECHTTLRADFTRLDLLVFLADKIAWDGGDNAPFKAGLLSNLTKNPEAAARYYIDFIIADGLKVAHPWLLAARATLASNLTQTENAPSNLTKKERL